MPVSSIPFPPTVTTRGRARRPRCRRIARRSPDASGFGAPEHGPEAREELGRGLNGFDT